MKKWICRECGYVHEGDELPDECPICHIPGTEVFMEMPEVKPKA